MKKNILFVLIFASFNLFAQLPPAAKLAAHYCFDNATSLVSDCGTAAAKAQFSPIPPKQICGINGGAIHLEGDNFVLLYDISYKFTTTNFSISFYFKPVNSIGLRDIVTNVDSCKNKRAFQIQYDASARAIKVKMKDEKRGVELSAKVDNGTCWQHVVFVREGNYHKLFLNGTRRSVAYSPDNQRISLFSNSVFTLGKSGCDPNVPGSHLRGMIDEFRFYDTAIKEEEAAALYDKPDRIKNQDVLLFIGDDTKVSLENTCAKKYSWSPIKFVDDPTSDSITIKPDKAGQYLYTARFTDSSSTCVAYDTIKVTVIDPTLQPCGEVYMPNAFTPNGDETNETFGISNPYTIGTLEVMEILDRWGGVVFTTKNPFERWNGQFNGELVQPGTYMYRIKYICQGTEQSKIGSFILLQ